MYRKGSAYLWELSIPVGDNLHLSSHRFANWRNLFVLRTHMATYGRQAFNAAGPATWNNLPVEIRQSEILTGSKSKLKTFLFTK